MKKILIVEDDTTLLKLLADVLSKQFQIYEACKVKEALHNLEENTVDLICRMALDWSCWNNFAGTESAFRSC